MMRAIRRGNGQGTEIPDRKYSTAIGSPLPDMVLSLAVFAVLSVEALAEAHCFVTESGEGVTV